jgi:hypothetical protein
VSFQRTFEDSKIFSSHRNLLNLFSSKGFVKISNGDVALQHMISKKMMTNLDVLSLRVLNWVVSSLDGTLIVAVGWHILHIDAIVLEGLLHP